jgi:hypothetical protein
MKKTKITMISLSLLSLAANFAVAKDRDKDDDRLDRGDHRHAVSAPEIDPAQAMGALALLGGTIAIIRGYRRRKK